MRRTLILFALCASTSAPSLAITGNQAVEVMTGNSDARLALMTYAMAVLDAERAVAINARGAAENNAQFVRPFCRPARASAQQAASIIEAKLLRDPGNNHLSLYLIARRALQEAWPCTDEQVLTAD